MADDNGGKGLHSIRWFTWIALFLVSGALWYGIFQIVTHSTILATIFR